MSLEHSYAFSLLLWPSGLKKKILEERDPRDLFLPHPGSAPWRIWPKNNNTCKGPWVLHPYQVSSKSIKRFWRRSWKCESLQTDDGRCAMTIAHLSLWLRVAKKATWQYKTPPKSSITQQLQTDFGRLVGVSSYLCPFEVGGQSSRKTSAPKTLASKVLVWLNLFIGSQPSH